MFYVLAADVVVVYGARQALSAVFEWSISMSDREQSALARHVDEGLSAYADGLDAVVPDLINLVSARK